MSEIVSVTDNRKFKTIVTDIGNAKIANAALNGKKVNVVTAVVGDGGGAYYLPTADMTALKHEIWRGEIANKEINAVSQNMVDIKIALDGGVGGFTVREIGLLDDEGDLIAICNTPDTEKVVIVDGIAATLTLIMHVVFTNVDVVEFTVDPSVDNVSAAEMEAAIKKHNEDPDAHGGAFPIFGGTEEPDTDGPYLWLKVIQPNGTPDNPNPDDSGGENLPDDSEEDEPAEPVALDMQDYHEGSDLYVDVDEAIKSIDNAQQIQQDSDDETLKIKLN
jgi:hypothetical protein